MNPTVTLTLVLLFLMVGAGITSASWGYRIGRDALKGITQPDTRPINSISDSQSTSAQRGRVALLKEEDILASVKARMDGAGAAAGEKPKASPASSPSPSVTPTSPGLPLSVESGSVRMEVRAVRKQNNLLVMDISLKNSGAQPVQFLYSTIDITNDQGRLLSSDTQNLPEELPVKSEEFVGTISVPADLLDDAQNLSLSLTDYSQQVQLQLSGIPVVR